MTHTKLDLATYSLVSRRSRARCLPALVGSALAALTAQQANAVQPKPGSDPAEAALSVPAPSWIGGGEATFAVWPSAIPVPQMAKVVPKYRSVQNTCAAATTACRHAAASCMVGGPGCGEPGHDCANEVDACALTRLLCEPLRRGRACPGFAANTDPGLRFLKAASGFLNIDSTEALRFSEVVPAPPASHVIYEQVVSVTDYDGSSVEVPVLDSDVTLDLSPAEAGVIAASSHFKWHFDPPRLVRVRSDDAVLTAVQFATEVGIRVQPSPVAPPKLVALRVPREGDRIAEDVLTYKVTLTTGDVAEINPAQVFVDASTGEVVLLSEPVGVTYYVADMLKAIVYMVPPTPSLLSAFGKIATCLNNEGSGWDRFGNKRSFSTTLFDTDAGATFATTSCGEITRPINPRDVSTCAGNGSQATTCWKTEPNQASIYQTSSSNEFWDDKAVVESQYWGERVLTFYKNAGFAQRFTPAIAGMYPEDARIVSVVGAAGDGAQHNIYQVAMVPQAVHLGASNGYFVFGRGDENTPLVDRTGSWTEPSVFAHEFLHSILWDRFRDGPAELTMSAAFGTISEALGDCMGMLFLYEHFDELLVGAKFTPSKFAMAGGVLNIKDEAERGIRNLESPNDKSVLLPGDVRPVGWAGAKFGDVDKADRYANSTLISGVCKLLVTGGYNPDSAYDEVTHLPGKPTDGVIQSLGWPGGVGGPIDEQLAVDRLKLLILEMVRAKKIQPTDGFRELIEAMAAQAEYLNTYAGWSEPGMGERVRRAFDVYGWGRSIESESKEGTGDDNSALALRSKSRVETQNLIAVGKNWNVSISGAVCCGDKEDFFALNEEVRSQDRLEWSLGSALRLRVYVEQPCAFADEYACSKAWQIFPVPQDNGTTPTGTDQQALGCLYFGSDASAPPGCLAVGNLGQQRVYIGIAPLPGQEGGSYTLKVSVKRASDPY